MVRSNHFGSKKVIRNGGRVIWMGLYEDKSNSKNSPMEKFPELSFLHPRGGFLKWKPQNCDMTTNGPAKNLNFLTVWWRVVAKACFVCVCLWCTGVRFVCLCVLFCFSCVYFVCLWICVVIKACSIRACVLCTCCVFLFICMCCLCVVFVCACVYEFVSVFVCKIVCVVIHMWFICVSCLFSC